MLKSRLSRVLKGPSADSLLLLFVRVITLLLSMVTTRILSQELSVTDYGTYSEITLLIATIFSLTIFGMTDLRAVAQFRKMISQRKHKLNILLPKRLKQICLVCLLS